MLEKKVAIDRREIVRAVARFFITGGGGGDIIASAVGTSLVWVGDSNENKSIHRLDLSGLTGPGVGGGAGVAAPPILARPYP